jgi:hypothetical protein
MGQITLNAWGKITTIEYPDDMDSLIPGAFGSAYGYEAVIFDDDENETPNPQSIEEFTIQKIFDYVSGITRSHGIHFLVAEARAAAEIEVESSMDSIAVEIEDSP